MAAPLIFIGLAASIAIAATHKPKQDYIPPDPPPPEDVHHYREGHRLSDLQIQYSSYGKVIPLIYGTVRLAGNVIWSRPILETQLDTTTSNSGNRNTIYTHHKNYTYSATLAIALCKGPITGISRIWAESKQIDLSKLNYTLYLGDETQLPDTTIVSFEGQDFAGQDKTPAYRGIAYVVIRDFPLEEYGNRIPSFSFEVKRNFSQSRKLNLEDKIKGVAFGQGVGEYLYDTVVQDSTLAIFSGVS